MSRRVRVNLLRWVCKHFGHRTTEYVWCSRCHRLIGW
jgi:hypothetical protein